MIQYDNVSKSFGDTIVVDQVSLTLTPGQTLTLIGPSGCGKSTLLGMLVGLIVPDAGRVLIDETELTPKTMLRLRHRLGYVIQDGGLFPHLTARENVVLMARELGWTPQQRTERLTLLCALTRFSDAMLDRFPAELSGGQRQRVSLMRALMLNPEIVILDEPLGALDPMIRADLQDDLKSVFHQLGCTVLLVTHDLAEAAFFGDSIVLMNEGRVVQQGLFVDLVERPANEFVSRFVQAQSRRPDAAAKPISV